MMPMMVLNYMMTGASGSGRNKRKRSTDDSVPALGTGEGPVSRLTFANVRSSVVDAPDPTAEDGQVDQDEIDLDEQCAKAMQVDFNDLLPFSAFGRSLIFKSTCFYFIFQPKKY